MLLAPRQLSLLHFDVGSRGVPLLLVGHLETKSAIIDALCAPTPAKGMTDFFEPIKLFTI
jgi:hypothetical protein